MKTNGPQLRIDKKAARGGPFVSLAASALFSLGQALLLAPVFPSVPLPRFAGFLICFCAAAGFVLLLRFPVKKWVFPAVVALLTLFLLIFYKPLTGGLALLADDLTDRLAALTGRILTGPSAADGGNALAAAAVLLPLSGLLYAWAGVRMRPWILFPLFAVFSLGTVCGFFPGQTGILCLFAGVLLLLIYKNGTPFSVGLKAAVPAAVLLCAFGLLIAFGGRFPFSAQPLRTKVKDAFHAAAYHRGEYAMPEGKLSDLGEAAFSDAPALEISLSAPQKNYFRGFIGETYTGADWAALPSAETAEARDLFYWLHSDGFYADGILAAASDALGKTADETLNVTLRGACARYAYLPYAAVPDRTDGAGYVGDVKQSPPAKESVYAYFPGGYTEWYALRTKLTGEPAAERTRVYLADEKAYRDYAAAEYLDLPAQTEETLSLVFTEKTPGSIAEIKEAILDAVDAYLFYDENAVVLNGENDFISYVLQQHTGGYSVHYATAAALMFRYFGVPARYVEGYFISADAAKKLQAGEAFTLTERDAHAWAEYYLDGVGWLPFECTPGYTDAEDLLAKSPAGENVYVSDALQRQTENEAQDQPQKLEPPQNTRPVHFRWLRWLLLLLPFVILLIALRSRLRVARRRRKLRSMAAKEAIPAIYGRITALCLKGASPENELLMRAKQWNDEALFSTHTLTAEQLAGMHRLYAQTLACGKNTWSPLKKLRFYWIEGLY